MVAPLSGDAEALSESEMIDGNYDLDIDVLKVGHHGSTFSSSRTFFDGDIAEVIISVGAGNDYGHPAAATLAALSNVGAKIFRTDEAGTIVVGFDGKDITVNNNTSVIKPRPPNTSSAGSPGVVAGPDPERLKATVSTLAI